MSVHLNIERLVVEGLPVAQRDRPALVEAVERELARQLSGRDWVEPRNSLSLRRLSGNPVSLGPDRSVRAFGTEIGRSIGAGISAGVNR
jgi:hypothetical protein